MSLNFPNRSRSYDASAKRIRFVGHDGMFEVPFSLEVGAFSKAKPLPVSEDGYLAAFDAARTSIYDVAREAYSHRRKTLYILTSADFK